MADFRRILGLAGAAVVFAGMAFGQATCANPTSAATLIRTEGTTELLADLTFTCTVGPTSVPAAAATNTNVTVYLSPALTLTSKVLSGAGAVPSYTEALATASAASAAVAPGATGSPATSVQGVVSGNTMTFTGIPTPAAAVGTAYTVVITNIRVNATSLSVGSGPPPPVAATTFLSGPQVVTAVLASTNVAFALPGLSGSTIPAASLVANWPVCNLISPAAPSFNIKVSENFPTAFKSVGTAAAGTGNLVLGSPFANNTETGFVPSAIVGGVLTAAAFPQAGAAGANVAGTGTRLQVVIANVPAGITLYLPQVITADAPNAATGSLTMKTTATGGTTSTITTDVNGQPGGLIKVTPASGGATVFYDVTTNTVGAIDGFTIPVYEYAPANTVTASLTPITETVSFAPVGSTNIPNFIVGANSNTVNANATALCTTTLLFPYVTNTLGFDTGLAIANTTTDALGAAGASSVTKAPGTCVLTFFGTGAPAAPVTTASIASGGIYTSNVSLVAPGFQGYMIANCNFLFGHGFAYITFGLGNANGAAMGYLADAIGTPRAGTVGFPEATQQ